MNRKKWIVSSGVIGALALAAAFAFTNPVRVFRTTAAMIAVEQGTDSLSDHPQYDYSLLDGSNLVALALGEPATSNQVFAMEIDCGSSHADLVVFDKANSNITTLAASSSFNTVQQQGLKSPFVNEERFVAQFDVQSVGDLAGGFLTVAGRLHLDANGCPHAVLISLNRDPRDALLGDKDVPNMEQDANIRDALRAGQAHFVGVLNVIGDSGTNTVLVLSGRMTFRWQLDQFNAE